MEENSETLRFFLLTTARNMDECETEEALEKQIKLYADVDEMLRTQLTV
ncbi:hypothetical protein PQC39_gp065 [Vibrio phage Vp_R1]|uniref:Uncharacterized protein n=1 Tax=Vibrio phage Vp_R1 TaxID=2059867 RepID=A0A2H5BQ20_9CAUD|nr:hypothetical protein PQC39_gp065 [Vibrio phage Vp_R1]AUG88429.1 hypothetical protein VPR_065 [Vibrio phage Vp_R1]